MTTGALCVSCLDYSVFFPSFNVRHLQPNDKVEQGANYRVGSQCVLVPVLTSIHAARVLLFFNFSFAIYFCILFTMLFFPLIWFT